MDPSDANRAYTKSLEKRIESLIAQLRQALASQEALTNLVREAVPASAD